MIFSINQIRNVQDSTDKFQVIDKKFRKIQWIFQVIEQEVLFTKHGYLDFMIIFN